MKLSDFKGLFKTMELTIESIENTDKDYYYIKMKTQEGDAWEAGEHGIFSLPNENVTGKKWRAFSVASIPEEGFLSIGTRTGQEVSSFKKALISMKKGDKVALRGPFGWFKVQDTSSPMILLAGGVGITPIRALLKALEHNTERPIELVYASKDHYLFDDELQVIAQNNKQIRIHKTQTNEETTSALANLASKYMGSAYYYISGTGPFIKAMKKIIKSAHVKGSRIINDPFFGY